MLYRSNNSNFKKKHKGNCLLSVLVLLSESQLTRDELMLQLRYVDKGTTLLFYQDAVNILVQSRFFSILQHFKIVVLEEDLLIRGLVIPENVNYKKIDYRQFVYMTLEHDVIQSW